MTLKGKKNLALEHDASPIQPHGEDISAKHHQVTTKLGAAPMKSTLSMTARQAMSLMIGSGPNVNFKRSLFSNKARIVFRSGVSSTPTTEIDIQGGETSERGHQRRC